MALFKIQKNKVLQLQLKQDGFGNEFNLHDLFAENLWDILGVRFLAKEYPTTDGRIDTLGIDESNSPVIIEYKWKENEEILSQCLLYFNWLMKNKKHFELLVDSRLGKKTVVNWDQPRVILVAQGFSRYVQAAVQQVENFELKTYSYYAPDILQIESVYAPASLRSIKGKSESTDEVRTFDLNYHLASTSPQMQAKMNELREKILQLPSVEEKLGQKTGITFKTTKAFTRLEHRKTWIQVLVRDPSYKIDTRGLVKDIMSNEWGYRGMIKFTPEGETDYIFGIVKASYESTL